jgi:hypothetical protein
MEGVAKTVTAYKEQNFQLGIDWRYDADSDRIINKWCKIKGISRQGLHLRFVDYLGNATLRDRMTYAKVRYKDSFALRAIRRIRKIFK